MNQSILFTMVTEPAEIGAARQLIESLRSFGGEMRACPVRVFAPLDLVETAEPLATPNVEIIPLDVPAHLERYPFGSKVLACARAEQNCPPGTQTLVWIDPNFLILQPPLLYALGEEFDAALRPVHIRNVGLTVDQPLDAFWRGVYAAAGVENLPFQVESFVDRHALRAYFNSHALALRPSLGLCQHWLALYESLLADAAFQVAACSDSLHRTFLFQAVFSALVATRIPDGRIRLLPPVYNYPYHLQERIPVERRVARLNDLVSVAYEDIPFRLADSQGFEVQEPLRGWLAGFADVR